jgi:hypothetical protein
MGTGMAYGRCEIPRPLDGRKKTLQEDLGCLCCVFPVAHGACEVAFLLEN